MQYVEVKPVLVIFLFLAPKFAFNHHRPSVHTPCVTYTPEPLHGSVAFNVYVQKESDCKSFYGSVPFNLKKKRGCSLSFSFIQIFFFLSHLIKCSGHDFSKSV